MTYVQAVHLIEPVEWVVLAACISASLLLPSRAWRLANRSVCRVIQRLNLMSGPPVTVALLATFVVGLSDLTFAVLFDPPTPSVHDEFAYLLSGDTFAAGRLTNPTPPFSEHFESFHILATPSFQGKYPPGQGLFLGLGQALFGSAAAGVWFSHALLAGSLCIFINQFMSRRWALLGAIGFTLADRLFMWWGQSYWGGAAAALGGTFLFLGFVQSCRAPRWSAGVWMGSGAGLLSVTRPLEGLVCCVFVLLGLAFTFAVERSDAKLSKWTGLIVAGAVSVTPWLAFQLAYNKAVTGSALVLPYQAWMRQYGIGLRGTHGVSEVRQDTAFSNYQHRFFDQQQYRYTPMFALWKVAYRLRPFYLPGVALLAVLGLGVPRSLAEWVMFAAFATLLGMVAVSPAGGFPHYLAPVAAPIALAVVGGIRWLPRRFGFLRTRRGLPLLLLIVGITISGVRLFSAWPYSASRQTVEQIRQTVRDQLDASDVEDALVLVLYGVEHDPSTELVYNGAQLELASSDGGPRTVWARSLGEPSDRALVSGFPQRAAYVYQLDSRSSGLVPFNEFANSKPGYVPPAFVSGIAP